MGHKEWDKGSKEEKNVWEYGYGVKDGIIVWNKALEVVSALSVTK